jgi:hypothetical protein
MATVPALFGLVELTRRKGIVETGADDLGQAGYVQASLGAHQHLPEFFEVSRRAEHPLYRVDHAANHRSGLTGNAIGNLPGGVARVLLGG